MSKPKSIEEKLDALLTRVDQLEVENALLKNRLAHYETPKNSRNSSKPPSSDFPKPSKTKSLREKSGKKVGGQVGHKGTTLKMVAEPTIVKEHYSNYCTCCGNDLSNINGVLTGKRQVIDVPPIQPIITDHQVYKKQCTCGRINQGSYPTEVIKAVS